MRIFFLILFVSAIPLAGKTQTTAYERIANKIATRLKDSLQLSPGAKDSLYDINLLLHLRKMEIRRRYTGTDSLTFYTQRVENTRDSLYHRVITDSLKYNLYKQKKRKLVTNN